MKRKIIRIDEEKCDGCGLCVPACAEGAIQIIDGKARLVAENLCDGLGACLGDCPRGALTIEDREAEPFDEEAVKAHLENQGKGAEREVQSEPKVQPVPCGCPGSRMEVIPVRDRRKRGPGGDGSTLQPAELTNWPVQLTLAPVKAPYFEGADLLVSADCVAYTYADFHRRFLQGRTLLIGCPKLDNAEAYLGKLADIIMGSNLQSITVLHMEVPCCSGLVAVVKEAVRRSGKALPLKTVKVGIEGDIKSEEDLSVGTTPQDRGGAAGLGRDSG